MNQQEREKILKQMSSISEKIDETLDANIQERGNIIFLRDFYEK